MKGLYKLSIREYYLIHFSLMSRIRECEQAIEMEIKTSKILETEPSSIMHIYYDEIDELKELDKELENQFYDWLGVDKKED